MKIPTESNWNFYQILSQNLIRITIKIPEAFFCMDDYSKLFY